MFWLLAYLLLGGVNLCVAQAQGILMLGRKARDGEGLWFLAEAGFYLLLWPLQAAFWTLVAINNVTGWALQRIFR